jgi:molybdopterin converting factor small subunit
MRRSILFFGRLRDVAGAASIEPSLPAAIADIPSLIDWLSADNAELGAALRRPGVRVAIDQRFATSDAMLESAREIAFMSPLSGG